MLERSTRNKTISLTQEDEVILSAQIKSPCDIFLKNSIVEGDCLQAIKNLPDTFVDLLVVDPPPRII